MKIITIDRLKLLYVEIPKAGCSSIKSMIMTINNNSNAVVHDVSNYDYIKETQIDKYNEYNIFTVVRNPVSRMLSVFVNKYISDLKVRGWNTYQITHKYWIELANKINNNLPKQESVNQLTFEKFVDYITDPNFSCDNSHIISQTKLTNINQYEYYKIYYLSDISKIKELFPLIEQIPHLNKTNYMDFEDTDKIDLSNYMVGILLDMKFANEQLLNKRIIECIKKKYADDYMNFAFDF